MSVSSPKASLPAPLLWPPDCPLLPSVGAIGMSVPAPTACAVDVPEVCPEELEEDVEPEEGPNDWRSGRLEDWLLDDERAEEPADCP